MKQLVIREFDRYGESRRGKMGLPRKPDEGWRTVGVARHQNWKLQYPSTGETFEICQGCIGGNECRWRSVAEHDQMRMPPKHPMNGGPSFALRAGAVFLSRASDQALGEAAEKVGPKPYQAGWRDAVAALTKVVSEAAD
jgi:hypothetical protein